MICWELYEDLGGEVPHQPGHLGHLGQRFRGYVEKYYEGLEVCKEMFGMAFSTLTDLAEVFPNIIVRFVKKIIKLL